MILLLPGGEEMNTDATMNMEKETISIVMERFLLEEVERFRRERLERSGHLSRSGAVRILVARGLEVMDAAERRRAG